MGAINDGGPAFPETGLTGLPNGNFYEGRAGMTLRDYFAAKAMLGELSAQDGAGADYNTVKSLKSLASWSYQIADAMLEARTKQGKEQP